MKPTQEPEDLDQLHALLGHYARQMYDLQKQRMAMDNRIGAMERDGLPEVWLLPAQSVADDVEALEHALDLQLQRLVRKHPMADWIKAQRGIGLPGFARLLGITSSLDRFPNVAKLWAYLGLHVVNGQRPRRTKGEKANWSPQGQTLCHMLGESIVKVGAGGPYRAAYDRKKVEYLERERRGPSECPFGQEHRNKQRQIVTCGLDHVHQAAMRYAVKELIKNLWVEWHRRSRALGRESLSA